MQQHRFEYLIFFLVLLIATAAIIFLLSEEKVQSKQKMLVYSGGKSVKTGEWLYTTTCDTCEPIENYTGECVAAHIKVEPFKSLLAIKGVKVNLDEFDITGFYDPRVGKFVDNIRVNDVFMESMLRQGVARYVVTYFEKIREKDNIDCTHLFSEEMVIRATGPEFVWPDDMILG